MSPSTDDFPQTDGILIVWDVLLRSIDKFSELMKKFEDDRFVQIGSFGKEINIDMVRLKNLIDWINEQALDLRLSWERIC